MCVVVGFDVTHFMQTGTCMTYCMNYDSPNLDDENIPLLTYMYKLNISNHFVIKVNKPT